MHSFIYLFIYSFICIFTYSFISFIRSFSSEFQDGWTHVAYTIDTSSKKVCLYVNGVLSAQKDLPLLLWCAHIRVENSTQSIETPHNYRDNMSEYWHIKVEGAIKYIVSCDARSSTEQGCDYL